MQNANNIQNYKQPNSKKQKTINTRKTPQSLPQMFVNDNLT